MLIVRTPVRISFGGGGTDLPAYYENFGGAVLSTTINKYFYTVLTRRDDGRIQIISADLKINQTWRDVETLELQGQELQIPLAALKYVNQPLTANIFLASEIPPGTGLGSSGAACVNVLRLLHAYLNRPLSRYQLAEQAFHIARSVLGRPVGKQDEYAAAFGGLNFIQFHKDGSSHVEPLALEPAAEAYLQQCLMLFDTGIAHNSWQILKGQERSTRDRAGVGIASLHAIRAIAERMRAALLAGDIEVIGDLLHAGWELKRQVSSAISNPKIDEAYEAARRAGALGGKIAGAGGGGFMMLFCPPEHQGAVRQALLSLGLLEMHFAFDRLGSHVVINDPFIDSDPSCGLQWKFVTMRGADRSEASV